MANNIVATTAERLQYAIEYRHTTAAQVSKETNISRGSLSQYMSGKFSPKQDRIYILSKHLRVSPAWLMGVDVPMEESKYQNIGNAPKANNEIANKIMDVVNEYLPTPEEQKMLDRYRKLTTEQQVTICALMETLETKKAPSEDGEDFSGNRR